MLIGVGIGLYALIGLTGGAQVGVLLGAAALLIPTGLGWFYIFPKPAQGSG